MAAKLKFYLVIMILCSLLPSLAVDLTLYVILLLILHCYLLLLCIIMLKLTLSHMIND